MKPALLILICAFPAFAAAPPPFPPPKVPDSFPNRLYTIKRATLVDTNRVRCTNDCPKPKTKLRVEWDHYGPGSQFIRFEVWGQTNIALPDILLAKTTNTYWERYFTSGPMVFVRKIYAYDIDQPNKSKPLLWGAP